MVKLLKTTLLFALLSAAGCAASPSILTNSRASPAEILKIFPDGAHLYLTFDLARDRTLAEMFFPQFDDSVKALLSKTKRINAALFRGAGRQEGALILLQGAGYPVLRGSVYLGSNADWEKITMPLGVFYRSKKSNLMLSLRQKTVLAVVGTASFSETGVEAPPAFNRMSAGALAAFWLPAAERLLPLFESAGIPLKLPLRSVIAAVHSKEENYEVRLRFETAGASQAKLMASLLNIARMRRDSFAPEMSLLTALFLANPPQIDGAAVLCVSAPLSAGELRVIVNLLPLGIR